MNYLLLYLMAISVEDIEEFILSVDEKNPWITLLNVGIAAVAFIGLGIIIHSFILHMREKRRKDKP